MTDRQAIVQDAKDLREALRYLVYAMGSDDLATRRAGIVRARAMVLLTDYLDKE